MTNVTKRIRVAVIFGGRSSEHEISCISAGSVLRAIDRAHYDVVPLGITRDGRWVLESDNPDRLAVIDGVFPTVDNSSPTVLFTPDPSSTTLTVLGADGEVVEEIPQVDVIFPVLHGPWGEDGTIQGLFEMISIPYVGSGVFGSAVSMDKAHMKALLRAAGLPVGPYEVITDAQWTNFQGAALERVSDLGLPLFVKPARAGSSVGITKVKSYKELVPAIEAAREHDPKVIIEASIDDAHEIECGVLSTADGPQASVCAEIIVHGDHEFYDFEAKYVDDSAELCVPAELDDELHARARAVACEAFTALEAEGLARVDMFIKGDDIIINEINTMPGFTPISMFPRMWAATGVDYPELVDGLLKDALRRGTGLR